MMDVLALIVYQYLGNSLYKSRRKACDVILLFLAPTFEHARTSSKVSDDNRAHQSAFPSLDLSSRCCNRSRALSPEP